MPFPSSQTAAQPNSFAPTDNQWWEVVVDCPLTLEESVYWYFSQLESKGTASQQVGTRCVVKAYLLSTEFEHETLETLRQTILDDEVQMGLEPTTQVSWSLIAEEDWSSSWKVHWQPEEVGDRLLINPAWMEPPETDRTILTLDPGSAFGTGAHATTQLCLKALEEQAEQKLANAVIADIGCGSGILSIVSLLYGAKQVYAADVDPLAIRASRDNANLNDIDPEALQIRLGSVGEVVEMAAGPVDGIVCNILSEIIVGLIIPRLSELANEHTWGILCGILTSKAAWVEEHLTARGWQVTGTTYQDEWCAMTIELAKPKSTTHAKP
ncbi:ribosomal protein L11 methyltransferase [Synechococcus sp. PCC 7335]|uniref:50S ribosomal protein L11 methyltransferase n=1 Tax=Synechococcus sp. (strain ATCC 29403 / PCC 7335) TaxID=91464 RepID=UPI00017EB8AD|nr:50S ribosomal protein L11 methyltransferase [Synechococcus sp. PCC 7335]EDX83753.1 ribosomal protein L11 methyltransferase [Synechococcus sp. PCC 7335]